MNGFGISDEGTNVSASERLKALDEAFDTPRFLGTLNYYIGPGARTLTSRENEKMYYDVKAVLVALPQILAVVEAAEQGRDRSVLLASGAAELVGWKVPDAQALQAALAALDEALT